MKGQFVWGFAAVLLGVGTAQAIDVQKMGAVKGSPADVWAKIGEFCAIADWHPAVASCEISEENGDTYRILALEGGGTIKEKRTAETETSYSYEIVESPLPVENYKSTFGVAADGADSTIEWSGNFDAKGAPDADAEKVITGIYSAGLDQIAADMSK